jgi:ABC-type branched-subunit amino acid transport system substrate-binding protein
MLSRLRGLVVAPAAVAALSLMIAGCGSGSSGSSDQASKAPVKIGVIVPENTQIYNTPDIVAAVRAAAYAENKAGGLDGHKVVVDYCNEQANPNQATACARQMVSDGVVATDYTLSVSQAGPQIGAILAGAGIPQLMEGAITPAEYASPNNYIGFPGLPYEYACAEQLAAAKGHHRLFVFTDEGATGQATIATAKAIAPKVGLTVVGSATIPFTAADYAPFVADFQAAKADAVLFSVAENQAQALITTARSQGSNVTFVTNQEEVGPTALTTLGAKATGLLVCSGTPPLTSTGQVPGVQTYISQVKAYHAATGDPAANLATMRNNAMVAWVGMQAIFAIGKTIPGLTASSLKHALDTVKDLQLPVVPPWTPSQKGIAGFAAISDPSTYQMIDRDGQLYLMSPKPQDETQLLK